MLAVAPASGTPMPAPPMPSYAELEAQVRSLQASRDEYAQRLQAMDATVQEERTSALIARGDAEEAQAQVASLTGQLEVSRGCTAQLQAEGVSLRTALGAAEHQIKELEDALIFEQGQVEALQNAARLMFAERDSQLAIAVGVATYSAHAATGQALAEGADLETALEALLVVTDQLEADRDQSSMELTRCKDQLADCGRQLTYCRDQLVAAEEQCAHLQSAEVEMSMRHGVQLAEAAHATDVQILIAQEAQSSVEAVGEMLQVAQQARATCLEQWAEAQQQYVQLQMSASVTTSELDRARYHVKKVCTHGLARYIRRTRPHA